MTSTLFGIQLKWVSLVTLVIQNSLLVLTMKYSRTVGGPPYLASTAVVLSELTKLSICLILHALNLQKTNQLSIKKIISDIFGPKSRWLAMSVPAVLYLIQNNLQYLAVSLLDAATFQVTYQLKILTTAIFSVLMLNKTLTTTKWVSLLILTGGIALVQLPSGGGSDSNGGGDDADDSGIAEITESSYFYQLAGLFAVIVACCLSGIAGVWFEKVLKGSDASVWLRNIQLSFFSLIPGVFIGVLIVDGDSYRENGFFYGYTKWTWAAILCQALGGLIVAVVVKYADNILKGFATSLSIILSCVASVFLFDFHISGTFLIGSAMVLYASHLYGKPEKQHPLLPTQSAMSKKDDTKIPPTVDILRSNKNI